MNAMGQKDNVGLFLRHLVVLICFRISICYNTSRLLEIYNAVCGNKICDKTLLTTRIDFGKYSANHSFCPDCSCDSKCIHNGNCCPDLFLSWQLVCTDTNLVKHNPYRNVSKSLMVTNCLNGLTNQCNFTLRDKKDMAQNIPVTSAKTGLTYRNIHCSICFNETVEHLLPWYFEMQCSKFADFNFLSSFDEIFHKAKEKHCDLFYSDSNFPNLTRSCFNNYDVVSACNVSGTWSAYDTDVDYACESYENRYRYFRNVFCYICNPPLQVGKIVDQCNVSGLWVPYDSELETACTQAIYTPVTGQFKNIYCFLCNRNNTEKHQAYIFKDSDVYTSWNSSHQKEFLFQYDFIDVNLERIINTETNVKASVGEYTSWKRNKVVVKNPNMLNLLQHYYAFKGYADFCHNYSFFEILEPCDCSQNCYFNRSGCCADKWFENSAKCTNPQYSSQEKSYYVLDSCKNYTRYFGNKLCEEKDDNHLFSFLPVEIKIDAENSFQYKNIYCALCSNVTDRKHMSAFVMLWTLMVSCSVYLPTTYYLFMTDYFNLAIENSCNFFYQPPNEDRCFQCKRQEYNHCNTTGNWTIFDSDISLACDHLHVPETSFCSICNPETKYDIHYNTCNNNVAFSTRVEENCLSLPVIEYHAPYKNYFCKKCNVYEKEPRKGNISGVILPVPIFVSYRAIFSFYNYEPHVPNKYSTTKCNESQILNPIKNECRDIHCYPGRFLTDNRCIPLLEITSNLGYILTIGIKVFVIKSVNDTNSFLNTIHDKFYSFLRKLLEVPSLVVELSYFVTDLDCSGYSTIQQGGYAVISVYQKLFFHEYVNRSLIEERLVSLPGLHFNTTYFGTEFTFIITMDRSAINLPSYVSKIKMAKHCFIKHVKTSEVYLRNQYLDSHINELLICQQIEIYKGEFELDVFSMTLKLLENGLKLNHDQFILMPSKRARICKQRFLDSQVGNIQVKKLNAWDIIQLICTCISLICLLCTFVTYSIFPSIRTVPGKNNMCLVFAIFCAHFTFQFLVIAKTSIVGCKVLGVLLHYFWLTVFWNLNVCSYHMYRVFQSKTGMLRSGNRQLIYYIIYSYGTPLLIIISNIVITAIASPDSSIGYGGTICFLNQKTAFIVAFISPITFVCLLNIFFFVSTAIVIVKTPKIKTEEQIQPNRTHFSVYLKLFTITGITYIFQVIDSFLPESQFSVIISLLNTLQGVFIFLSYSCNTRVLNLYKNARMSMYKYTRRSTTESKQRTLTTNLDEDAL